MCKTGRYCIYFMNQEGEQAKLIFTFLIHMFYIIASFLGIEGFTSKLSYPIETIFSIAKFAFSAVSSGTVMIC